jgi:carboxypeptidase Taq
VQAATPLPVSEFPIVDEDGRVHEEPFYVVMGFAPTEGGLGVLCRVSQKQVVNVAQRGGLAAVLIGHPPAALLAPMRSAPTAHVAEAQLRSLITDMRGLDAAINLLGWDEETYLPAGARAGRGAQLGVLESLKHRLLSSDRLGDLVEEVAGRAPAASVQAAELTRLRRMRRLALAVPEDLVRAFAEARSQGLAAWENARDRDDYALFAPTFDKVLGLVRERAQALRCSDDIYDGLLDEHEPGMRRARLDPVLEALRARLVPLVATLVERSAGKSARLPGANYPEVVQERFCRDLLARMGFDFTRGRIDRSTHPFTLMAGEDDVRITIRVHEDNPLSALFATLHEGGHALYDQGYALDLHGTLLAEGPSMGIHESQSRLWENHVGRSAAFAEFCLPALRACFPEALAALSPQAFYETVNIVRPSLNRVEADEVSYNLHILLRYELELGLIRGDMSAADLPGAWSDLSDKLLGLRPASALQGCLQDVHWAIGAFGYFPTYTLGNLYAAQLVETYALRHAGFDDALRAGELSGLLGWLRRHVHQPGHRDSAEDIIARATGVTLGSEAFFRMLARKHAV